MPQTEPSGVQVPCVGDIVLYYHTDSGLLLAYAALVTRVERPDDPRSEVILTVFRPRRAPEPFTYPIPFAEGPASGYWGWRPAGNR